MGGDKAKQYLDIAGKPIIAHTLDRFAGLSFIDHVVVVVPPSDVESFSKDIIGGYNFPDHWKVVAGGEVRQQSVMNGLNALPSDVDVVIVHDGVRPFIAADIIEASVDVAARHGGCVVALPVKETIKKVTDGKITGQGNDQKGDRRQKRF
jgi:2-C-methyl-D-erythritol 4-phosphate cytidylyltransferase